MGLRVQTNQASLVAQRNIEANSRELTKSYTRVSSGNRVTQASDDAAGLAISENLHAQIRGIKQASRNAGDGISIVQTAEGALNEVSNILIRLRELGVQAANDTLGDHERAMIDKEYQVLKEEIDRIGQTTNFNGTPLLKGGKEMSFHVGAFGGEEQKIVWDASALRVSTAELDLDGVSVSDREDAEGSLEKIDEAILALNTHRAGLGAMQTRLHSATNSLGSMLENLTQARSNIADTDIAAESTQMIKNSILQNAGVAVLAQANSAPQAAMRLL